MPAVRLAPSVCAFWPSKFLSRCAPRTWSHTGCKSVCRRQGGLSGGGFQRRPAWSVLDNRTVHLAGWHECERRTSGSLRSIWSDRGGRRSIAPLPARVSFVLVAIADEAYSWLTSQSDWFARSVAVVHVAADGCGQRMIHRIHPRLGDVCIIARCCKRCVANFRRQVTLRCNAFGVAHRRL